MQSRKWFIRLTKINETKDNGVYTYNFEDIYKELCNRYDRVAICEEIGTETEKEHCHILLQNSSVIRFNTLKKLMPYGNLAKQRGSAQECLTYMSKQNAYKCNVSEDLFENADCQGARTDLVKIYNEIKNGKTTFDVVNDNPDYMLKINSIERFYQMNLSNKFKKTLRTELKDNVYYIFGKSGTGKTSGIYKQFGYENVYRVTDYKNPFDSYESQDVIVFEEFRNSINIENMLNYLDIYPLQLPARYGNKVACYTKVFIVSNWELKQQYKSIQEKYPETFNAFLRRISVIREYTAYETYTETKTKLGSSNYQLILDNTFDDIF